MSGRTQQDDLEAVQVALKQIGELLHGIVSRSDIKQISAEVLRLNETVRRGDHAHEVLQQVLYCASGRCLIDLEARDGTTATFELAQGGPGLFLNGPVWRTMHHFAPNTALIVLCDREYALDTVVRNRAEFKG